ncbi:MAG: hypothetical protein Roseis2KO_54320 [Roseivirga sp.]
MAFSLGDKPIHQIRQYLAIPERSNNKNKRARILIYTLLVIGAVASFYFFIFIRQEKTKLIEKNYQVLERIESNLLNKIKNFKEISQVRKQTTGSADTPSLSPITISAVEKDSIEKDGKRVIIDVDGDELYHMSISDLIAPLIPKSFFEKFVVINNDKIVFSKGNGGANLGQTIKLENWLTPIDTVPAFNSKKVKISDKQYYLFPYSIDLKEPVSSQYRRDWVIVGIVDSQKFDRQTSSINIWLIVILTLLLLVIVISLPILKVVLINDIEPFDSRDLVLSGMSIIIGATILFMAVLAVWEYAGYFNYELEDKLEKFAEDIDNNFYDEVRRVYDQIKVLDEATTFDLAVAGNDKKPVILTDKISGCQKFSIYPHFNELFWVGKNGEELGELTRLKGGSFIDFKDREYFKRIKDQEHWKLPERGEFYLESIVSWVTGRREGVISVPSELKESKGAYVVGMSTKLSSVMDVMMPRPYEFAITDETGEVLFHSNPERNRNENFLIETGENTSMAASLFGHIETEFQSTYWGKRIKGYIAPSKYLPFNVIVYAPLESSRSFVAEVVSFCLVVFLVTLVLLGILTYGSFRLQERPKQFVRFKTFGFRWVMSKRSNRPAYMRMLVVCLITSSIFFFFYFHGNFEFSNTLALSMLIPSILFIISYWNLELEPSSGESARDIFQKYNSLGEDKMMQESFLAELGGKLTESATPKSYVYALNTIKFGFIGFIGFQALLVGFVPYDYLHSSILVFAICSIILITLLYYSSPLRLSVLVDEKDAGVTLTLLKKVRMAVFHTLYLIIINTLLVLTISEWPFLVAEAFVFLISYMINDKRWKKKKLKTWAGRISKELKNATVDSDKSDDEKCQSDPKGVAKESEVVKGYIHEFKSKILKWHKAKTYYLEFVIVWLIAAHIFPVFVNFHLANMEEGLVWDRYQHLSMVKAFEHKTKLIKEEFSHILEVQDEELKKEFLRSKVLEGNYYRSAGLTIISDSTKRKVESESSELRIISNPDFLDLLYRLRPNFDTSLENIDGLVYPEASNKHHSWYLLEGYRKKTTKPEKSVKQEKKQPSQNDDKQDTPETESIEYSLFEYQLYENDLSLINPDGEGAKILYSKSEISGNGIWRNTAFTTVFFLVVCALLCGYGMIIRYFNLKAFGKEFDGHRPSQFSMRFLKEIKPGEGVVYNVLPASRIVDFIGKSKSLNKVQSINTLAADSYYVNADEGKWLVFEDLAELFRLDLTSKIAVLNSLKLLLNKGCKILIVSSQYPTKMKDVMMNQLAGELSEDKGDLTLQKILSFEHGWMQVFSSFKERVHADPLLSVKHSKKSPKRHSDKTFGISMESQSIYESIWHSLTNRQKYILIDLAEDGFVNTKGKFTIISLINKGLLIFGEYDGFQNIYFTSKDFRDFVLQKLREDSGIGVKKQMMERGAWASIKISIYIIVVVGLIFIALSEPAFFQDFNTFMTIIAGIVTLLPTLGSLFSVSKRET